MFLDEFEKMPKKTYQAFLVPSADGESCLNLPPALRLLIPITSSIRPWDRGFLNAYVITSALYRKITATAEMTPRSTALG